jgi:hypothetical protein
VGIAVDDRVTDDFERPGRIVLHEGPALLWRTAARQLVAEHALYLVRVDVIGAHIVGRRGDDVDRLAVGHLLANHAPHQLGNLHQR